MFRRNTSTEIVRSCLSLSFLLIISALLLSSGQTQAVIVWSNPSGNANSFTWENGLSDKGLYGNPAVNGNSLTFTPTGFIAQCSGVPSSKNDRLQFDIIAKPGLSILGIIISEQGDYSVSGTKGWVSATGSVTVINLTQNAELKSAFTPSTNSKITSGSGPWIGTAEINDIGWTHIRVIITNNLLANGTGSFIEKNQLGAGVSVQILVPEPATLTIFAMGLLVFPLTKRYRKHIAVIIVLICGFSFVNDANAFTSWSSPSGSAGNLEWQDGGSKMGLFGDPVVDQSGTFIFTPSDFFASSFDVPIEDTLIFILNTKPGFTFSSVDVTSSGEYLIIGDALVNVIGSINIINPADNTNIDSQSINVSANTEGYDFWTCAASITNLNETQIKIAVPIALSASTSYDDSASLIWHTSLAITFTTIPEPATIALLTMGLSVFIGRKKIR